MRHRFAAVLCAALSGAMLSGVPGPGTAAAAYSRPPNVLYLGVSGPAAPTLYYLNALTDPTEGAPGSADEYSGGNLYECIRGLIVSNGAYEPTGTYADPSVCPTNGPAYSPDGKTLVFGGFANPGADVRIFSLPAVGGRARWVRTRGLASVSFPEFLPDGSELVLSGRAAPGAAGTRLYTVPAGGGTAAPLSSGSGSQPAVCGDGRIVYVHDGDLYLLARGQRGAVGRLIVRDADNPVCSAGSRTILYDVPARGSAGGTLYRAALDGAERRRLSPPGAALGRAAFSPRGTEVAYTEKVDCPGRGCSGGGGFYGELTVVGLDGRVRTVNPSLLNTSWPAGAAPPPAGFGDVAWRP